LKNGHGSSRARRIYILLFYYTRAPNNLQTLSMARNRFFTELSFFLSFWAQCDIVLVENTRKGGTEMKKILISAIAVVLVAGTGYFAYRYANPEPQQMPAPSSSSVVSLQAVSSAAPVASQPVTLKASSAVSSAVRSKASQSQQKINQVKAAVNLDWKKYTLKAVASKVLKNTAYDTYEIWDEDYLVGPKVLVDQSSGKIYTWASSDTAPVPVSEDKAFDKTVHTVIGTMQDGAMMSIVIKTDDGNELSIRRLGVDTTGLKSLKNGDRIKVTYTGVIKGNDTSRAFITKLENVK
jgi:hypothetical protein